MGDLISRLRIGQSGGQIIIYTEHGNPIYTEHGSPVIFKKDQKLSYLREIWHAKRIRIYEIHHSGCFRDCSPVLLANAQYKPIKDVKAGDKILSFSVGAQRILEDEVASIYSAYVKEYIRLRLSNSMEVECTSNHQFLCKDGKWRHFQTQKEE